MSYDPVEADLARYHNEQTRMDKAFEAIDKQVASMTLKDILEEINTLVRMTRLQDQIWNLIQYSYRAYEPRNEIDALLEDLIYANQETFINHLGLESKVREMFIETLFDQHEADC